MIGGDSLSEGEGIDPKSAEEESPESAPDSSRRIFLKYSVAASAIIAAGGIGALVRFASNPTSTTSVPRTFPRVRVANVNDLVVGRPVLFVYPLDNEPNLLVKLGVPAQDGVGPDGDVVAFSQICQHLGCIYGFVASGSSPPCNGTYRATGPVGYCCCHGSVFDLVSGARVVGGPSPRPQPRVILEVDGAGNLYAIGMGPPAIFGHGTGSDDVSNDLVGGILVG